MSNLRINGKTYRDIEKMSPIQLKPIADLLVSEMKRLVAIINSHNQGKIQAQVQTCDRQLKSIIKLIENKTPKESK